MTAARYKSDPFGC